MKNWINNIAIGIFSLVVFTACMDDDPEAPSGGEAPAFGALTHNISSSEIALSQENDSTVFVNLSWPEVDFGTTNPVKYTIELGYAGEQFQRAIGITTKEDITSYDVLVAEVNAAMISLGVDPEESAAVEIRVRAWVDFLTDPSLSDPISVTLTPYLLTFPPIYVVGDAQGWNIAGPDTLRSFAPGIYEGVVRFQNNGNFRFFEVPDWGAEQWGFSTFATGSIPEEFINAGDGDSNFKFTGLTAEYGLTVNFNTQVITLETLGPPPPPAAVFFVTAQTFDLENAIELESEEPGVYSVIMMLEQNTKFRVFTDQSWDADKLAWDSFDAANELLQNSGDDVSNILFTGETGYYLVTVSLNDMSIQLEPSEAPSEILFLIGAPNGWQLNNTLAMRSLGGNAFELIAAFETGQTFRFFEELDWGADQFRWSTFANGTVDSELEDGGGGDSNFRFAGASGVYKLTVSLLDKAITVEPAEAPTLHLMGGDQGWTPANAVELTWMGGGTFQGTADFTNNSTFRFFANNDPAAWDWSGEQWRYSSFAEGTIDTENLGDGGGGDSNFRFIGTTGTYTITVNVNALTIDID